MISTAAALAMASSVATTTAPAVAVPPVWLSVLKDAAVITASATGAVVAVLGLTAWRRQLQGQTEYDLSKRLLHACYRYRDAIAGVRHPWMGVHEMPFPPADEAADRTDEQKRFYGLQKAYESRWERVREARADLYPELLEAEVLWGGELSEFCKPLYKLETKLALAVRDELTLQNPDLSHFQKEHLQTSESADARFNLLYSTLSDDDEFEAAFQREIDKISGYLKRFLKR